MPATARRAPQTFAEMAVVGGQDHRGRVVRRSGAPHPEKPDIIQGSGESPTADRLHPQSLRSPPSRIHQAIGDHDELDRIDREPATLNRYKATLSRMYQLGKVRHHLTVNPAAEFKQRKPPKGKERFLKPEEEARIRAVMDRHIASCGPQNAQLRKHLIHRVCEFEVALGTGMRRGEQYGLTWDDVDFNRREVTARDTKNGTDRVIPMIDTVVKAMHVLSYSA